MKEIIMKKRNQLLLKATAPIDEVGDIIYDRADVDIMDDMDRHEFMYCLSIIMMDFAMNTGFTISDMMEYMDNTISSCSINQAIKEKLLMSKEEDKNINDALGSYFERYASSGMTVQELREEERRLDEEMKIANDLITDVDDEEEVLRS